MTAEMVSVDDALAALRDYPIARREEELPLAQSNGRVLAEALVAAFDRPAEPLSAMDGYAVRLADVSRPGASLTVIGEAPAGNPFRDRVAKDEAVRLFTGSVIPPGADHVVMQEYAARDGDRVRIERSYDEAAFVRPRGLDFETGTTLVEPGTRLTPSMLALAASADRASLRVAARPRVMVLANGDELVPPGSPRAKGQAIEANRPALLAMVAEMGGDPIDGGILPDDPAAIRAALSAEVDLFLPVGGASVGEHDHMRAAFGEVGFDLVFDRIAVKPGKPCWFGVRGQQRVLGLPGNPASALVCARLFMGPLLGHGWNDVAARLMGALPANGPREHFMRASIERGSDGVLEVETAQSQDSSLLTPFVRHDALVRRRPDAPAAEAGEMVSVIAPECSGRAKGYGV